ncbi:MAG: hypothetical protein K0S61_134 [Anaerocolumna sp.]|jgi:hypothetical protein|nr:hypothetical protein [Anaerocolumna sp.]
MARFYGTIGYSKTVETSPGVWTEEVTERNYYGDVIRLSRRWQTGDNLNDDLTLNNEFSIVADPFAYENFYSMKYIKWMGALWKITKVDVQRPRLILSIGGIYNGKTT